MIRSGGADHQCITSRKTGTNPTKNTLPAKGNKKRKTMDLKRSPMRLLTLPTDPLNVIAILSAATRTTVARESRITLHLRTNCKESTAAPEYSQVGGNPVLRFATWTKGHSVFHRLPGLYNSSNWPTQTTALHLVLRESVQVDATKPRTSIRLSLGLAVCSTILPISSLMKTLKVLRTTNFINCTTSSRQNTQDISSTPRGTKFLSNSATILRNRPTRKSSSPTPRLLW